MPSSPPIVISSIDARRLESLLASLSTAPTDVTDALGDELARAELREPGAMPADVVTMNSRVVCIDEATGAERELSLVYPADADAAKGAISVLAPVGAALLGLSVGQSIEWPLPGGRTVSLRGARVLYQPESQGIYD